MSFDAKEQNHGASTAMTHIAIVERLDGNSADWLENVTGE